MRQIQASRFRSLAVLAALAPVMVVHRFALWLDRWLYPSLESTPVRRPLFIVGIPRSGTTLAHRLIASQRSTFTTFPLWELIVAPALCEKHLLGSLARIDRCFGAPAAKLVDWLQRRLTASLADVHPTTLSSPEEDYLGLMPFGGCFLKVLLSPYDEEVWQLVARTDCESSSARQRERRREWVRRYRGLLARHLKYRGEGLTVLSKNPSFTHWVPELADEFPDAAFIGLRRDLRESLPSQLSSMREGFAFFGHDVSDPQTVDRFSSLFRQYWQSLDEFAQQHDRFALIEYQQLKDDPYDTVIGCLARFGFRTETAEHQELVQLCEQSRCYVSRHRYDPTDFGLDEEQLHSVDHGEPIGSGDPDAVDEPHVLSRF